MEKDKNEGYLAFLYRKFLVLFVTAIKSYEIRVFVKISLIGIIILAFLGVDLNPNNSWHGLTNFKEILINTPWMLVNGILMTLLYLDMISADAENDYLYGIREELGLPSGTSQVEILEHFKTGRLGFFIYLIFPVFAMFYYEFAYGFGLWFCPVIVFWVLYVSAEITHSVLFYIIKKVSKSPFHSLSISDISYDLRCLRVRRILLINEYNIQIVNEIFENKRNHGTLN